MLTSLRKRGQWKARRQKGIGKKIPKKKTNGRRIDLVLKAEVKRTGKSQLEITITVPQQRVAGVLEKVYDDAAREIEIKGFRKGQAPKNLVREKIDQSKAYGEVVNRLVPEAYNAAVKEHLLKPIASPRIEIIQFEPETEKGLISEGKNERSEFIFKATTAERPEVKLGDYKKELAKLKVQKPAEGIVGPDGKLLSSTSKTPNTSKPPGPSLGDALTAVLSTSQVDIPDILTENEVNRMLSRLIDQTTQLGLTVEQYLQSQNKTTEQLRTEYGKQAEETLKAEFVLDELAQKEKIEVTDKEIADALQAVPDEKSKTELAKEENKWYIRSILKRNKTMQRLMKLAK
jgi:FKBP-type peptidyl-prolyl cis-trans isomerase (trigger factor)